MLVFSCKLFVPVTGVLLQILKLRSKYSAQRLIPEFDWEPINLQFQLDFLAD